MVDFKIFERIIFSHFLTNFSHKSAYESGRRLKICLGSSNHLSKSCIKKSSLYLLAVTNDSVFKSALLSWDTLYIKIYAVCVAKIVCSYVLSYLSYITYYIIYHISQPKHNL